ncbi:MAG: 30S ribosomal protein S2 [Methylohalobius sp.]|nr:30S ribosomal protein S2 [Methylohalobius sp.]
MADVSMRELLEAGVHFGHQTRYWNPKMASFIYGVRSGIHILNLEKTLPYLREALHFLEQSAANRGVVLFVGTKKTAQKAVQEEAVRCGMPYVNYRWLGGTLTNFKTIRQSVKRLKELEAMRDDGTLQRFSKREALELMRKLEKLQRSLGGIKDMEDLPDVLFVLDVGQEAIAVKEAQKLGIPIVGVVDTNNSPDGIDYIIPGNDDSIRAIQLYCRAAATAILEGKASRAEELITAVDEFVEAPEEPAEVKATSELE